MSKEILIPMIYKYLDDYRGRPFEVEDEDDDEFLGDLRRRIAMREDNRGKGPRVFSPSSIGHSCIRYPYLSKTVEGRAKHSPSTLFTFATGNYIHEKLQFMLYKMGKWIAAPEIFEAHGFEISILSKRGDFGGTMDVVASILGVPYVIDIKGLNGFAAKRVSQGSVPSAYKTQVGAYLLLWNSQRKPLFRINDGMLLVEDKSGGSTTGKKLLPQLSEAVIDGKMAMNKARRKVERLREFDEMPPPACRSLHSRQFQGCPMRSICWDEVREIEKTWSKKTRKGTGVVATPQRVSTVLGRRKNFKSKGD